MTTYYKPLTCTRCEFKYTRSVTVHGDFDGWDSHQLRMSPSECPFCQHARNAPAEKLLAIPRLAKLAAARFRITEEKP